VMVPSRAVFAIEADSRQLTQDLRLLTITFALRPEYFSSFEVAFTVTLNSLSWFHRIIQRPL